MIRGDKIKLVTFGDGDVETARGAQGGKEGTLNVIKLRYPDGKWYTCTTKDLLENVPEGTLYFQQAGGGGGWGEPMERSAVKVLEDVRNGVLSLNKAVDDFGVFIDPTTWMVDEQQTRILRNKAAC
jgi:N-methylhydantoinase B